MTIDPDALGLVLAETRRSNFIRVPIDTQLPRGAPKGRVDPERGVRIIPSTELEIWLRSLVPAHAIKKLR